MCSQYVVMKVKVFTWVNASLYITNKQTGTKSGKQIYRFLLWNHKVHTLFLSNWEAFCFCNIYSLLCVFGLKGPHCIKNYISLTNPFWKNILVLKALLLCNIYVPSMLPQFLYWLSLWQPSHPLTDVTVNSFQNIILFKVNKNYCTLK